jgi:hypothetical protein
VLAHVILFVGIIVGHPFLFHGGLTPNGYNMMVTPKEIDADIEDLAKIISGAIDTALHKSVTHS